MSVAAIRFFPDPVLRLKCQTVKVFNKSLKEIGRLMECTMELQPLGIGIAAPQIGIPKRIAIVDVSRRVADSQRLMLVNPEILDVQEERLSREGCMSLPDYSAYLKRYDCVRFRWQDVSGYWHEKTSRGIEAICVQHELDHLNGILFVDRVACLKNDMVPRKMGRR